MFAQPFDVESRQLSGEPVPVAENVAVSGDRYGSFSASDTGVLMYGLAPPVESRLVWKDRMGREVGSIGPPGGYTNLSLSPDDQRVAVSLSSGNPPNRDIWTIDLRTSATARLTFDRTSEMFPTWSPDGSVVAFIGGDPAAGRRYNLSLRDSAGRGAEQILIENEQPDRVSRPLISDWADDGRHVVFTQANMITGDLWILPVMMDRDTATGALPRPSGKPRPFIQSEFSEDSATFAPGSRWMAYQSNVNGTWEVFVEPFPSTGERHQVSRGGGSQPLWRRDGQELFFIAPTGEMMAVPVQIGSTFQSGTPQALFASGTDQTVGANRQTYAVTRDGQRFLINVPQRAGSPPLTALVNWQTMTQQR